MKKEKNESKRNVESGIKKLEREKFAKVIQEEDIKEEVEEEEPDGGHEEGSDNWREASCQKGRGVGPNLRLQ